MKTNINRSNEIKKYIQQRFLRGEKGYFDLITGTNYLQSTQLIGILYQRSQKPNSELSGIGFNNIYKVIKNELGREWDSYPMTTKTAYKVGEPRLIFRDEIAYINTWTPPKVFPKAGDISPFLQHLYMALGDTNKVEFILDFVAHRFQHPDIKAPHALYLYGRQGMGKGTLKEVLQGVFGKSAIKYAGKASAVTGVLNWSSSFFIADEIKITKHSEFYNEIKAYTVETELEDRILYANYGTYDIPAQLILFSNHAPSFLEEDDRRFFVAEWDIGLDKTSVEYQQHFRDYYQWIESENGLAALAHHLQHRDLSNYGLRSAPPMTSEKAKALSIVADPAKLHITEMLEDNPNKLVFNEAIFSELAERNAGWRYLLSECGLQRHDKRIQFGKNKRWVWYKEWHTISSAAGKKASIQSCKTEQSMPLESVFLDSYDFYDGQVIDL